jgi:hypothetical protein
MDNQELLQNAATEYAARGWQVFPLQTKSKIPRKSWSEWQNKTSDDEEIVFGFWEDFPGSNIAVRLGEASGIIDIECDSEAGENWLVEMFGGAENVPVTPTFQSRSDKFRKHRLFKYTGELPKADRANWRPGKLDPCGAQDVDFKVGGGGKGSYSVFPPSVHPDTGDRYQWLVPPDDVDPAELPDIFIANLFNAIYGEGNTEQKHAAKPREHWEAIAEGVGEGDRNQTAAEYIGKLLRSMRDPYHTEDVATVFLSVKGWNMLNRPPLDAQELKRTFDSILTRHRKTWTNENEREGVSQFGELDPETGEKSTAEWRLVKVGAEPIRWKLYSPLWEKKAPGGCVVLTSGDMGNMGAFMREVLEQAGVYLSRRWFPAMWDGTKTGTDAQKRGLAARLVENCEYEEAPAEERRSYMIAEVVHGLASRVEYHEDFELPDYRGKMTKRKDGTIWFKVAPLLDNLQHFAEPVKAGELSKLLKEVKAVDKQARPEGVDSPARFKVFTKESLDILQKMSLYRPGAALQDEETEIEALHAGNV